ncbi:hypothetical protein SDC9_208896 [bioreactor metagenome]|uniref:Uncharacterized protein n=1 Tax=bioreactor metagenome TaxID=1076179 RepID=A0A645JDA9_9ZZZZ
MLFPLGCLDSRIHLTGNAEFGKTVKRRLLPYIIILHSLKQADHALLDQVVILSAQQIHGVRFFPYQVLIFFHDIVDHGLITVTEPADQLLVRHLLEFSHTYPLFPARIPTFFSA